MNPNYLPRDPDGRLWRLVEECGEVSKVAGKIGRFGLLSRHPDGGPTNAYLLMSELCDLRHAIDAVMNDILPVVEAQGEP